MRQRHTGDGREMNESRSRLGLGLSTLDRQSGLDRHSQQHSQQQPDSNGLDLYYNRLAPREQLFKLKLFRLFLLSSRRFFKSAHSFLRKLKKTLFVL